MYELNELELASVVGGAAPKIKDNFSHNKTWVDQSTTTGGGKISYSTTSSYNTNVINSVVISGNEVYK